MKLLRLLALAWATASAALTAGCGDEGTGTPAAHDAGPPPGSGWEAVTSLAQKPLLPCAMTATGDDIALATGSRLALFDPDAEAWDPDAVKLPRPVATGVCLAWDAPRSRLLMLAGEGRDFWSLDPATRTLTALAPTPEPVGRGAFLAVAADRVFAVRGAHTRHFWAYDPAADAWSVLPEVAGPVAIAHLGATTGFLAMGRDAVYAWPDHHVQRFDHRANVWGGTTWSSMGFRPHCDGGALTVDHEAGAMWFAQGRSSRALGVYDPPAKQFHYVRPRAPELVAGEGSRLAIQRARGRRFLWLYVPEPSNRFWRIPLDGIERITRASPASDVGSAYASLHEADGASLVRHEGIDGAMGSLGADAFWFMRLRNIRFLNPTTEEWTRYPGVDATRPMAAGLCGAADDRGGLFFLTGGGSGFFHLAQRDAAPAPLPDAPAPTGIGARLARSGGMLFALRGGNTRDFWRFDPEAARWDVMPPIPDASAPIGDSGTGLVDAGGRMLAFAGTEALAFHTEARAWRAIGRIGFACSGDGGMEAFDPAARHVYLVRGAGTPAANHDFLDFPVAIATRTLGQSLFCPARRALTGPVRSPKLPS